MRGLTLTLTWTPIILVLVILLTSPFPTQAQSRERTIIKAQIEELIKKFKQPESGGESPEQKLKRLLDCTQSKSNEGCDKSLVINELLLRRQIREMGEACTSDGNYSTALYGSPYRPEKRFDFSHIIDYEIWQDKLLDTGLTFCSPFKHLICSSISKKCECRPGTVLTEDTCSGIIGGYCWIPGIDRPSGGVKLYDPITLDFSSGGYTGINPSLCQNEFGGLRSETCHRNLNIFPHDICVNKEITALNEDLGNQFKDLPRINFGESCNLEHQTQFYTTTDEEMNDYKIRIKNLKAIIAAKSPFCDIGKLLICGSGGKCECIEPTTYNNETKLCTFKNPHETCERENTFEQMAYNKFPWPVTLKVGNGFQTFRERECPLKCDQALFPNGKRVQPNFQFCISCPRARGEIRIQVVGKKCDKSLTLLLEGAPPPSFPIDIPDYDKQLELFVQFNEKAKEFEKLFRLEKYSPCDYEAELDAYRSIRRIKNVELPDKIFTEQNYKDLMSSMDKHMSQFGTNGLCRYHLRGQRIPYSPENRPLLLCGPTDVNPVCYEPKNRVYLDKLVKRLSGKSFEAPTSGSCAPHPKDIVKFAVEQFPSIRPSNGLRPIGIPTGISTDAHEYLFNTLENHWIDNSQFCNRTGGFKCTKSVDDKTNATGICEFSKAYLDEVNAEEAERLAKLRRNTTTTSKSSHHSIRHFSPTLLFTLIIIVFN